MAIPRGTKTGIGHGKLFGWILILTGLGIAAWTGVIFFEERAEYGLWLDANGSELSQHHRTVGRFNRRLKRKLYPKLPDGTYDRDLEAMELSSVIVKELDGEHRKFQHRKKRAFLQFRVALVLALVLLLVARRMMPSRWTTRVIRKGAGTVPRKRAG